jgi:hypothetical protein
MNKLDYKFGLKLVVLGLAKRRLGAGNIKNTIHPLKS